MGIDELLEELGRRAREREAQIRREAEAEAERILERARSEAEELRDRSLEEAAEELRADLSRERASVERRQREQVMEARAELLDRVRGRAADLLAEEARGDAYRERLPRWLREARSCLPADEEVVVRCGPALEDVLGAALAGLRAGDGGGIGEVRLETGEDVGTGFRAAAASGAVVVDATLDRLLARDWEELARGVVARLEERWAETGAP